MKLKLLAIIATFACAYQASAADTHSFTGVNAGIV